MDIAEGKFPSPLGIFFISRHTITPRVEKEDSRFRPLWGAFLFLCH